MVGYMMKLSLMISGVTQKIYNICVYGVECCSDFSAVTVVLCCQTV